MGYNSLVPGKRGIRARDLSPKHLVFADEYVANGLRGTDAARVAGYKHPGIVAVKLLKRPDVKAYVESRLKAYTSDRVLRVYKLLNKMARLNDYNLMEAAVSSKGGCLEISADRWQQVAEEIGDCVTEIETEASKDGTVRMRIKLMSKDEMFRTEMKYYGLLVDRTQHEVTQRIDWEELLAGPPVELVE